MRQGRASGRVPSGDVPGRQEPGGRGRWREGGREAVRWHRPQPSHRHALSRRKSAAIRGPAGGEKKGGEKRKGYEREGRKIRIIRVNRFLVGLCDGKVKFYNGILSRTRSIVSIKD